MFLRTVKAAGGQGVQHEYGRLVEAYRGGGRASTRFSMARAAGGRATVGPWRTVRWCWWPIGCARRRASMAWPAGWRRISSAAARGGAGGRRGGGGAGGGGGGGAGGVA